MKRSTAVVVAILAILIFPDLDFAGLESVKIPLTMNESKPISMKTGGLHVTGYRFARLTRSAINMFKPGAGPTMEVTIRNEGETERDFSLAAALFDKSGHLVGVAADNPKGKLEPGEEAQIKLSFKDFNRYASHAATAQISLETHID